MSHKFDKGEYARICDNNDIIGCRGEVRICIWSGQLVSINRNTINISLFIYFEEHLHLL